MTETDGSPNLPAVIEPQQVEERPAERVLQIPVAEFEGEYVRIMIGKLPGITLPMDAGYARGTHLKMEVEARVSSVRVGEVTSGRNKGDLAREHQLVIESIGIVQFFSAEEAEVGVGGGLAATGHDVEDEEPKTDVKPEGEDDGRAAPDRGEDREDGGGPGDSADGSEWPDF